MSSNTVGHLLTRTITTLQHFATLHHTSPNYTSLNLATLHLLSFTLHYPLIWLNPFTFPTVLFHLPSLNYTQYSSHLQTYFQNNEISVPCSSVASLRTFGRHRHCNSNTAVSCSTFCFCTDSLRTEDSSILGCHVV
jgi:hypothetical protein